MTTLVSIRNLTKTYQRGPEKVEVLHGIDLDIAGGDFVALMGPSGSGKTTLLNLIGCLDVPTSGRLVIGGRDVGELSDDELTYLRRDTIGFIFQQFNLIPLLSVLENVEYPRVLKCGSRGACGRKPEEVLRAAGLAEERLHRSLPSELSGGQQQRVAIARALVNDPDLLLCDEPTGNLDQKTGQGIMELLVAMNREGKTVIMVTHDPGIASYARRQLRIVDGQISEDSG